MIKIVTFKSAMSYCYVDAFLTVILRQLFLPRNSGCAKNASMSGKPTNSKGSLYASFSVQKGFQSENMKLQLRQLRTCILLRPDRSNHPDIGRTGLPRHPAYRNTFHQCHTAV